MKKLKMLARLMAIVLCVQCIAACSPSDDDNKTSTTTTTTTTQKKETEEKESETESAESEDTEGSEEADDTEASDTGESEPGGSEEMPDTDGPLGKYDPEITITTAVGLDDTMQQMLGVDEDALTDNNWFKGYKEELGINVEYAWSVPSVQYDEKINTLISANDLPDLYQVNPMQLKTLVDAGMIADLTDVYNEYRSDFTAEMMDVDNHVALGQATYDDKLMAIPNVGGSASAAHMMWIRQDWLDKLGLEAPKTMDELRDVAEAFTTQDPDGNGEDDTTGIELNYDVILGGLNDATGILEGFGAYPNGWIDDGEGGYVYGRVQPEMREGLEYLAELYEAGYIDPEFSAKDNSRASEALINGFAGITFGQHWVAFWPLQETINANPDADWVPYPLPTKDGGEPHPMIHGSANGFEVVNVDAEHPEAVVQMLNYYYKKDNALSPDFDSKFHATSTEQMERPRESFAWAIVKSFYPLQNIFIHRGVVDYLEGDESALENSWVKDNGLQCEAYLEDPAENSMYWSSYRWSGPESAFSVVDGYMVNDQLVQNAYVLGNTDGMTQYMVTLDTMALETFTKIIMGSEPIDEFDNFVEQWYSLGGEQITQEVNDLLAEAN